MYRRLMLAAAPLALSACVGTGIQGAAPVSAGQAAPISAQERQQGTDAHPSILAEYGGAYSGPQSAYAERVGRKIAVQSGLSDSPAAFNVTLLNSPVNNAFAIPGGYVYSTRQLMALMNDEAELAAVLGHEVAHVAARHSAKRQSAAQTNQVLGALGQLLVGAVAGNGAIGNVLSQGIGTGAQLVTLGYSRSQETQADDLGIDYLVKAGYDPMAMATVLASLEAQNNLDARISGGNARSVPAWASTHPDPGARVARAQQQAQATGIANGVRNRDAFLNALDGVMYGDDPKQGVIEGRDFLHPSLGIGFTIPQGFTMQNGTKAVSISGSNAQAQFSTAAYSGNLESYIGGVFKSLSGNSGSVPQFTVQRTSVNGIPAGYATIRANSGGSSVDATVFAYTPSNSQAYHFIIVAPAGQGVGALSPMVQSFRKLTSAQASAIKPRFVRVVTVKSGDTINSLASRMAFDDYKVERFLVLNGLNSNSTLQAGQRVKIVTR